MTSTMQKNEVIKKRFFEYLRERKGSAEKTIECYENALWVWEDFLGKDYLDNLKMEKAISFKNWLKEKKKGSSEGKVSLSYCYDKLRYLRLFFEWLSEQNGYKKIDKNFINCLSLSKEDSRIVNQPRGMKCPLLDDVRIVIESIKGESEVEMRDRALISLIFLTGARISAVMTLSMQTFDRNRNVIYQDPKLGVKTKFKKRIVSKFITFSYKEPQNYFLKWYDYLEKEKGFGVKDPIFPATKMQNNNKFIGYFNTGQVEPIFWKSSSTLRAIFRKRFQEAGVKYYHPHTLRHLLVTEAMKRPLTEQQKKAISQNFGHENVGTTFGSCGYGQISENSQIEVIESLDSIDTEYKQDKLYIFNEDMVDSLIKKSQNKKSSC